MNTNFFSQLAQLEFTGSLQMIVAKGSGNSLVVSVLLLNEQCGDKAKNLIPPFSVKAAPDELDSQFFEHITTPVQTVSKLMVDMEAYLKQVEEAQKQSAMEKGKSEREQKEKDTKEKKFREAMSKVDDLEKEGKFREAWIKVPDPTAFPEHSETIRKRKEALSDKFAPDLFGTASATATTLQPEPVPEENGGGTETTEEFDDDSYEDWEEELHF